MKKRISLILALLMLVSCCMIYASAEGTQTVLSAEVKSTTLTHSEDKPQTFRTAINLSLGSGISGISAYTVTVSWDPEVLELVSNGSNGCYFTDSFSDGWDMIPDGTSFVNYQNIAKGELTVSSVSAGNRTKANGTLFVLEFRTKAGGNTKIEVKPGSSTIAGEDALASKDGNIPNVTPSTSLTLSIAGESTNKGKLGDVNGDGEITARDYMMLKRGYLGVIKLSDEQRARADVNKNGRVDALDYILLKRHVLGITTIQQ